MLSHGSLPHSPWFGLKFPWRLHVSFIVIRRFLRLFPVQTLIPHCAVSIQKASYVPRRSLILLSRHHLSVLATDYLLARCSYPAMHNMTYLQTSFPQLLNAGHYQDIDGADNTTVFDFQCEYLHSGKNLFSQTHSLCSPAFAVGYLVFIMHRHFISIPSFISPVHPCRLQCSPRCTYTFALSFPNLPTV